MSKFLESNFFCTTCGQEVFSVLRKEGAMREPGHLKKLWCWHCQAEHNAAEIKSKGIKYTKEDFDIEFKYGNFDKEGNRIKPIRQFIAEVRING